MLTLTCAIAVIRRPVSSVLLGAVWIAAVLHPSSVDATDAPANERDHAGDISESRPWLDCVDDPDQKLGVADAIHAFVDAKLAHLVEYPARETRVESFVQLDSVITACFSSVQTVLEYVHSANRNPSRTMEAANLALSEYATGFDLFGLSGDKKADDEECSMLGHRIGFGYNIKDDGSMTSTGRRMKAAADAVCFGVLPPSQ